MTDVREIEKRGFEERQFAVREVELRDGETTTPILHGYASTFNQPYKVHDRFGEFQETILPGAWTRSLQSRGEKIHLLIAHGGIPLAATHSETLRLSQDNHGLEYEARADPANPLWQQVMSAVNRRDMDEMSVGMRIPTTGDRWNDDNTERFISEAALVEISVLPRGANGGTTAGMRADQLLAEIRHLQDMLGERQTDDAERTGLAELAERRARLLRLRAKL